MEMECLCLFLGLLLGMFLQETCSVDSSEELDDDQSRWSNYGESSNIDASKVSLGYCYPGPRFPRDCKEVYDLYYISTDSRTHIIQPDNAPNPFPVYCNNSIDGGGWTVLQRRVNGSVDFYRNWSSYKHGFGVHLKHEFWLGLDNIHFLTNQQKYTLRIDFINRLGDPYHAKFDHFVINGELDKYRLSSLGTYSGTAYYDYGIGAYPGRALFHLLNYPFSTYDRDNEWDDRNCAAVLHGAWWYRDCASSNLNGGYNAARGDRTSIHWGSLPGPWHNIKYTSLMIRPT